MRRVCPSLGHVRVAVAGAGNSEPSGRIFAGSIDVLPPPAPVHACVLQNWRGSAGGRARGAPAGKPHYKNHATGIQLTVPM